MADSKRLEDLQRYEQPVVKTQGGAVPLMPTDTGKFFRVEDVEQLLRSLADTVEDLDDRAEDREAALNRLRLFATEIRAALATTQQGEDETPRFLEIDADEVEAGAKMGQRGTGQQGDEGGEG